VTHIPNDLFHKLERLHVHLPLNFVSYDTSTLEIHLLNYLGSTAAKNSMLFATSLLCIHTDWQFAVAFVNKHGCCYGQMQGDL